MQRPGGLGSCVTASIPAGGSRILWQLQKADAPIMCQLPVAFLFVRCTLEIDVGLIGFFDIKYLLYCLNSVFSHVTIFQNQKVKYMAVIQIQQ